MKFLLFLLILIIICTQCARKYTMPLSLVNKAAPDFNLPDQNNTMHSLHSYRGKKVVLYFYPKDNTPGCTAQACSFRDVFSDYENKNIVILGINYDSPESHKKFTEKYHLPFTLLSDTAHSVAKAYGAYSSIINKIFPKRITFLIDERGIIRHILDDVDVKYDARKIMTLFEKN